MMGDRLRLQENLFYAFNLEQFVPGDHILRAIDRFVDLDDMRGYLADYYSATGRPSVDPELIIRMLIVGYCFGIRSERRLCEEVHLNLAYRWFCHLDLEAKVPDHSTFSKNRHGRFRERDLFRHVFDTVVQRCLDEGLIGGDGFAVDASLIAADANKQKSVPSSEATDWQNLARSRRSVQEYLDTLDDAAWGAASESTPKFISKSDPASQWSGANKGHAFFAYSDNYLIDLKSAVIVDVEATRSIRQAEVGSTKTMLVRAQEKFGLKPNRLAADTAYGTADLLHWLDEEQKIAPHIPVFDKSARRDGTFARADFTYDAQQNSYTCPGGKTLRTTGTVVNDDQHLYRASKKDCEVCPLKPRCCPKEPARKVPRNIHEKSRDVARAAVGTSIYERSCRERKKIEMLFAHLKNIVGVRRLRLRGPCGAKDEFTIAAMVQNLRKLAKLRPIRQMCGA